MDDNDVEAGDEVGDYPEGIGGNDHPPPADRAVPAKPRAIPGLPAQLRDAVIAAMAGLFQVAAGAIVEDPHQRKQKAYRIFDRLGIQTYTGDGGPTAADYWLDDVQRRLQASGTPPEYWVDFTSHRLGGRAYNWFRALTSRHTLATMT